MEQAKTRYLHMSFTFPPKLLRSFICNAVVSLAYTIAYFVSIILDALTCQFCLNYTSILGTSLAVLNDPTSSFHLIVMSANQW